jgi:hypothetical protein
LLLVKIEIPLRLPVGVADDEAFVVLIEHPRRPEAAVRHFGWHSTPSIEIAIRNASETSAVSAPKIPIESRERPS